MRLNDKGAVAAALRMVVFSAAVSAIVAHARQIDQDITLTNGWNAVYVSVAPEASADEVFAGWPVWSVSAYNAAAYRRTVSAAGGATGESVVRAPYWIWSREAPHASALNNLQADTVLVCFSTSAVPFNVTLRGVPVAPRLALHASKEDVATLNPVGVRLSAPVKAREWFAGCDAVTDYTVYNISGPDDAAPRFRPIATGTKTAWLKDGDVVFVPGAGVSDWSGPLYIMPRSGLDFGDEGMQDMLTIRNDGVAEKTVRVEYIDSADGSSRPELLYRESLGEDAAPGWQTMDGTLSRTISTGETWKVVFALDRSKLAGSGVQIGGVLSIAEEGGTCVKAWVPVSAKDVKPASEWPQGLWRAELSLSKVSYYTADSNRVDGVAAGGRMKLTVYVHMDADGTARLLQRVTVGGVKETDGTIRQTLYGPGVAAPNGLEYETRLSSAALPVDMPATASESGEFGVADVPLVFKYTIGATSPSNPFRHALHPLFDNKQMDFKTPAPDGDDISNYVGSVKPELFSIGGEVQFTFAENAVAAWTPLEKLSGACRWIYTGVRRDGPVVADGSFTMQRIVKAPDINL